MRFRVGRKRTVIRPHPDAPEWSYVATLIEQHLLRGYVQGFRITTQLPEPCATLYPVKLGDRLGPIAARIYRQAIEPGRDLRFYENIILYLNQQAGRGRRQACPRRCTTGGGPSHPAGEHRVAKQPQDQCRRRWAA